MTADRRMRDCKGGSGCVYDADGSGSGGSGRREDSGFEAVTNSIILGYEVGRPERSRSGAGLKR